MRTVILDPLAPETAPLIARRRRLGLDLHDEVWEGEYHMVPHPHVRHGWVAGEIALALGPRAKRAGLILSTEFNVGDDRSDFRVPDLGFHRGRPSAVFMETVAIVVEVLSPEDESYDKFDFYARHRADEVLIADPDTRRVEWWVLAGDRYTPVPQSTLLGITADALIASIDWP